MGSPPAGRDLPRAAFGDDDGTASVQVRAALDRYAGGVTSLVEVVGALQGSRLLVPVVPVPGEEGGGASVEGTADQRLGSSF